MYIYERSNWPHFEWNNNLLLPLLSGVRHQQGRLLGQMENIGFPLRSEALLQTLTLDVLKSNEIEGDMLDKEQVRSSIARRLGIETGGLITADRKVEGVVEMLLDATQNYQSPITAQRLFGWHAAMFPGGHSGLHKISIGQWRNNDTGPMQVVSGPMGKEIVHFEAPDAKIIDKEMRAFLTWFNNAGAIDPVLKAGLAHFWFVTIHPFDDGNGRIARSIADMQLARADGTVQRFYSMSAQIRKERPKYYDILEKTQKGGLDLTDWLEWFLLCLGRALTASEETFFNIIRKAHFWEICRRAEINSRQQLMLNKLLEGFEGKLTTSKWAKITKSSQDTALRDIQQLVEQDILIKESSGGRSTSYVLKEF